MTAKEKAMEVQEQQLAQQDGTERTRSRDTFIPRADIFETEDDIYITLDMPGANESQIEVVLEQNVLNIRGMTSHDAPSGYELAYAEFHPGDYERSFRLSDQVDSDKIDAVYADGELKLTLPKAEVARTRKISVKPA